MAQACASARSQADPARKQLSCLVSSPQAKQAAAAASLREDLEEALTALALGITGALQRTLRTTNPIENLTGSVAHYSTQGGTQGPVPDDGWMVLPRVAGALGDAASRMRKPRGCGQVRILLKARDARRPGRDIGLVHKAA